MTASEIEQLDPRKYRQIYLAIRTGIASGDIPPGTRIPSITYLTVQYSVARGTVAKAMRDLASEGLIVRYPGHGYFATSAGQPAPGSPGTR